MKILPMIICSNERKDTVLKTTLESFRQTDWPEEPICVFDGNIHNDKFKNIGENSISLIRKFLDADYDYLLYLEDDIRFNKYLYHNLINWPPLKYNFLFFGSLYNCVNIPYFGSDLAHRKDNNYTMIDTCTMWGSQALILKKEAAKYISDNWLNGENGYPDIKIPRLIQKLYSVSFYYSPSLVQHEDTNSLVGLRKHFSNDFDMDFKI